ncbi:helix-turn-helix transcriptional regulator [Branchiibius sp. NY16-3462-2]|uniref:helix-turn-helix domain-containing protein n=1 Tax=Branchiibius sp. NY16-3462-2 TaxID=1807500 RepID=UPI0025C16856|nr:helix-turn-helix transcriptional regulator [Branchiibius sp. NY16-3462-2]
MSSPLGSFLRARREALTPAEVGLEPEQGRRVRGLRREEVALRAGISRQYYLRLEQGRDRQPSREVIEALADALLLGDEALPFMVRLVELQALRDPESTADDVARERVAHIVELLGKQPVLVADTNFDIVAANPALDALTEGEWSSGNNVIESMFGHRMQGQFGDWERAARKITATLRFRGNPFDRRFRRVVTGLERSSPEFRWMWSRHDVGTLTSGQYHHRVAGEVDLDLGYQIFVVPSSPRWVLTTFDAKGGSASSRALDQLGLGRVG